MDPDEKIWHCHKLEVALLCIWEENLRGQSQNNRKFHPNCDQWQYLKDFRWNIVFFLSAMQFSTKMITSGFQMAWTSFGSARSSGSWKKLRKVWKCERYWGKYWSVKIWNILRKVWKCESVRVWKCESVKVWKIFSKGWKYERYWARCESVKRRRQNWDLKRKVYQIFTKRGNLISKVVTAVKLNSIFFNSFYFGKHTYELERVSFMILQNREPRNTENYFWDKLVAKPLEESKGFLCFSAQYDWPSCQNISSQSNHQPSVEFIRKRCQMSCIRLGPCTAFN